MIKLDIASLIFFYIILSTIIILIAWLFFSYKKMKRPLIKDADYIWRCSVCFHGYVDSRHEDISVCPLCGSFNDKKAG